MERAAGESRAAFPFSGFVRFVRVSARDRGRATRAVLAELRRRVRGMRAAFVPRAAAEAESFGELVGVTAASSVEALALVLALTVLSLAPLLC